MSARSASTQPNDHASSPLHHVPHELRTNARDTKAMNVFDDNTAHNPESTTTTMTSAHDTHTVASAVIDAPEPAQPSPAEPLAAAASQNHTSEISAPEFAAAGSDASGTSSSKDETSEISAPEFAASGSDYFAAALQHFETETEEAVGEDHVIKGRVVKLTATHVVVDIGAKPEGMVPLTEALDTKASPSSSPVTRLT